MLPAPLVRKIKRYAFIEITKEELAAPALLRQVLTPFEFWGEKPTKRVFIVV